MLKFKAMDDVFNMTDNLPDGIIKGSDIPRHIGARNMPVWSGILI
jgi:hypothetical protein